MIILVIFGQNSAVSSVHFEPTAKASKLNWNKRTVNAQVSMRGSRVYPTSSNILAF